MIRRWLRRIRAADDPLAYSDPRISANSARILLIATGIPAALQRLGYVLPYGTLSGVYDDQ